MAFLVDVELVLVLVLLPVAELLDVDDDAGVVTFATLDVDVGGVTEEEVPHPAIINAEIIVA